MAADLSVTSWARTGDARAWCDQPGCQWPGIEGLSPSEVADAARQHARLLGHPAKSEHVQVTRYELAGTLPLEVTADETA